jgi:predicted 2-oxoglutarate/Fe(II)-dependent dioxygenase YbiX
MEILADKIVRFKNNINSNDWINLVEKSSTTYPFKEVDRRPHLTMELPNFISEDDDEFALQLRSNFLRLVFLPIQEYMNQYSIDNMAFKKDFITVSKLTGGGMSVHKDDKLVGKDNFICMLYLNDNFEGGELFFPELGLEYKPTAGDVVLYQAKMRHGVKELISGTRYNIGMGFKGPIKD